MIYWWAGNTLTLEHIKLFIDLKEFESRSSPPSLLLSLPIEYILHRQTPPESQVAAARGAADPLVLGALPHLSVAIEDSFILSWNTS